MIWRKGLSEYYYISGFQGMKARVLLEWFLALVATLILIPLLLVIAISVRLSGRQVIFKHKRVGKDGRVFSVFKFRTMVPRADDVLEKVLRQDPSLRHEWCKERKLKKDPRVTKVGRILRTTSLDELPQLFNILKGEMAIVGPRPVTPEELIRYGRTQRHYLKLKPGITGLWQVSGRNDVTYSRRVAMDRFYVENRTLAMDACIVLKTVKVVALRAGAY